MHNVKQQKQQRDFRERVRVHKTIATEYQRVYTMTTRAGAVIVDTVWKTVWMWKLIKAGHWQIEFNYTYINRTEGAREFGTSVGRYIYRDTRIENLYVYIVVLVAPSLFSAIGLALVRTVLLAQHPVICWPGQLEGNGV